MMNDTGKILFAQKSQVYCIKIIGHIRFPAISWFSLLLDRIFKNKFLEDIFIDMTETIYLDSTNLGGLADLALQSQRKYNLKPTIISIHEEVDEMIENIGFHKIFTVIHEPKDLSDNLQVFTGTEISDKQKTEMIYNAHKVLSELNEKNKDHFKNVIDLLESDIGKL